ncbi:MAG: DUF4149 domain-containing protein [Betaproteobacteria bacterium]|nr:DUF4149 domain-containing protein [Betaproteobacteria bacterium]
MRRLANLLFQVVLTAWAGCLWTIGYLVAPILFYTLDNRALAGQIAGSLFAVSGWASLAAGSYLALFLCIRQKRAWKTLALWLIVLMLILAAVSLFGIQPMMAQMKLDALPLDIMNSPLRDRFVAWHGISSSLYLLESCLALGLVLRMGWKWEP